MATKGDVELIIRARNEASKALDTITSSLGELITEQNKLTASSDNAGSVLTQLTRIATTVGGAYNKVTSEYDKAAASFARQTAAITEAKAQYSSLVSQLEGVAKAQQKIADIKAFTGPPTAANAQFLQSSKAVDDAQKSLAASAAKVAASITAQEGALARASTAMQQTASSANAAADAVRKVDAAQRTVGSAAAAADAQRLTLAQQVAAQEQQLADRTAAVQTSAIRRSALEVKRSMTEAAVSANTAWQTAQGGLARLATDIARSGGATAAQAAEFERLRTQAAASKQAYSDLTQGISKLGEVLRTTTSSQDALTQAQQRGQATLSGATRTLGVQDGSTQALRAAQQAQQAAAAAAAATQAQQAAAAESSSQAQIASARRTALETKKAAVDAAAAATDAWRKSQTDIARIQAMRQQPNISTGDSAALNAQFDAARTKAAAQKQAVQDLQAALASLNGALRTAGASQGTLNDASQRTRSALDAIRSSAASTAAAEAQLAEAARRAAQAVREQEEAERRARTGTSAFSDAMSDLFSNSRRSLSVFQRLRGEVLGLVTSYVGLYAAIDGVNKVLKAAQDTQAAKSRLGVVTGGDTQAVAQEMRFTREEADRLGFSFTTVAEQWSKFAAATKGSSISLEQSRGIFVKMSEAGRVLKLTDDQVQRSFLALTQMASKGTIQMEELRGQLGEHLPGAFQIMADAVGVSTAQLTKMMEQGKLTSDYLIPFADELSKRFSGQLPTAINSTQAEMGRFQTATTAALNVIAESGVLDAFTAALKGMREQMTSTEGIATFRKIGAIIGVVIDALAALARNLDIIILTFIALGAAKTAAGLIALVQTIRLTRAEIVATEAAMTGLGRASALVGGPIGIAVGILAAGIVYLSTRVTDSQKAFEESKTAVDEVTSAYLKADKGAQGWADTLKGLTLQQQKDNSQKLNNDLKDQRENIGNDALAAYKKSQNDRTLTPKENAAGAQINALIDSVKEGKISVVAYQKALSDIGLANPGLAKTTLYFQNSVKDLVALEEAARKAGAALRLREGTASDNDKAYLGIKTDVKETREELNATAAAAERYKAAMNDLKKATPIGKLEVERDTNLAAVQTNKDAALRQAGLQNSTKGYLAGIPTEAQKAPIEAAAKVAIEAINEAFADAQIKLLSKISGDVMTEALKTIKQAEGFVSKSKIDSDGKYRVGYGSDTQTAADGRVTKVTSTSTTTEEGALRDLVRRIGEFTDTVKNTIGAKRFDTFTPQQQGALVSMAYNYGRIPEAVAKAIKDGSPKEIGSAVRALGSDNNGINRGRRNKEADILGQENSTLSGQVQKEAADAKEAAEKKLKTSIDNVNDSLTVRELKQRQSVIEAEIYNETVAKGIPLESEAGQEIAARLTKLRTVTAATEAQTAAEKRMNALVAYRKVLQDQITASDDKGNIDKSAALSTTLKGVNDEIGKEIGATKTLNDLLDQRRDLNDQINLAADAGNTDKVTELQDALQGVVDQLAAATKGANDLGLAMSSDSIKQGTAALKGTADKAKDVGAKMLTATQVNEKFAEAGAKGFLSVGKSMSDFLFKGGSLGDIFHAGTEAFLNFASSFLLEIAEMIIKQAIFNAISGAMGGGGGVGGFVTSAIGSITGQHHDGGIAGEARVSRVSNPAWFTNATRYHTGGIAGLQPNEVPAILQKGEEVLPATDPRHVANGGGATPAPVNIKVVNAIDAGDVVQQGLNTAAGEQAIMNFIQANKGKVKSVLG